jgi:hypothetical protein
MMASFKLNFARIEGCPSPAAVAKAMEAFGLPESEEFGVLSQQATETTLFGTIVRRTQQALPRLDPESKELTAAPVERVTVYPFGIKPSAGKLEVYAGSAAGIEQVGTFLSSCLALPTMVEGIELDIPGALDKLAANTKGFQLRAIRVSEYAHNSYMVGPYAPKFLDSEHGKEFMEEHIETIASATVRFTGPKGKVGVNISPKACFSYSCNEDDQAAVQAVLRKLV